MFSVLNVYKPLGLTSHDVVARLRKVYGLKRIGHLGTLDPQAEGVLPVCLGQATRLIEYFPSDKGYRAEITLGITTTTLDREGEVLARQPYVIESEESIQTCLKGFEGTQEQQVPLHSAVHVNGKKLYRYAQQGIEDVELPVKTVTLHRVKLLEVKNQNEPNPILVVDVHCSSGTYIRSLARDIGKQLGCGAYLSALTRTQHGQFSLEQATPLETLQTSGSPTDFLLDPVHYLELAHISLPSDSLAVDLNHGKPLPLTELDLPHKLKGNQQCLVLFQGRLMAVAQVRGPQLKPLKVFPQQETAQR
jgi:tRNA pseudouridine55 synthase